jgi:hypothetical protein
MWVPALSPKRVMVWRQRREKEFRERIVACKKYK